MDSGSQAAIRGLCGCVVRETRSLRFNPGAAVADEGRARLWGRRFGPARCRATLPRLSNREVELRLEPRRGAGTPGRRSRSRAGRCASVLERPGRRVPQHLPSRAHHLVDRARRHRELARERPLRQPELAQLRRYLVGRNRHLLRLRWRLEEPFARLALPADTSSAWSRVRQIMQRHPRLCGGAP